MIGRTGPTVTVPRPKPPTPPPGEAGPADGPGRLDAAAVRAMIFPVTTALRSGYLREDVTAFLTRAADDIERLRWLLDPASPPPSPARGGGGSPMTGADVRRAAFRVTRLAGGFRIEDVDDYLDRLEAEFVRLHAAVGTAGAGPRPGAATAGFVSPLSERTQPKPGGDHGGGPFRPTLTSADVRTKVFRTSRYRTGYEIGEVDRFLAEAARELERIHRVIRADEQGRRARPDDRALRLSPEEITNARFNPTRLRSGYDEQDVDDYLDVLLREFVRVQDHLNR